MRLYDIAEQYNDLLEMLEGDADNEALQAMIEGLEGAFDAKAENIVKVIKSMEGECQAVENESKRLNERATKIGKNIDRLKFILEDNMKRLSKEEVKSNLFTIKFALKPPSVRVDESLLPEKYYRIIPASKAVDKAGLAKLLKDGATIKGAWLEQEKTLRIK